MIQELAERSDHSFERKEGTLYPILHNLENKGCLSWLLRITNLAVALVVLCARRNE